MNSNLHNYFEPDEKIVWEGSPYPYEKKSYFHKSITPFMIWLFILLSLTIVAIAMPGGLSLILYFYPLHAIGMWVIYLFIAHYIKEKTFSELAEKGNIEYYITNKKMLTIINEKNKTKIFLIELIKIKDFKFNYNIYGIGNLSSSKKFKGSPYLDRSVCIKDIANVEDVYNLVIPYIDSKQIYKNPTAAPSDDPIYKNISPDGEVLNKDTDSIPNQLIKIARIFNIPTVAIILFCSLNMGVVDVYITKSFKIFSDEYVFMISLMALILILQIYFRIKKGK